MKRGVFERVKRSTAADEGNGFTMHGMAYGIFLKRAGRHWEFHDRHVTVNHKFVANHY